MYKTMTTTPTAEIKLRLFATTLPEWRTMQNTVCIKVNKTQPIGKSASLSAYLPAGSKDAMQPTLQMVSMSKLKAKAMRMMLFKGSSQVTAILEMTLIIWHTPMACATQAIRNVMLALWRNLFSWEL